MSKTKPAACERNRHFFQAATKGDVARLNALLGAGQKIEARDDAGRTALMRAAERGHVESARALLSAGADASATVSDRDSIWFGCNALLFAAQSGNADLVELLIKAGAPPGCEAADGTTPLSLAVEHGVRRMVDVLLRAGAPPASDILVASVWNGTTEVSALLIRAGADVNARNDLGQSVLHRAAEEGQLETVRALIRSKAKLNPKANGSTPLLAAIKNRHAHCALELIQAGADLTATGLLRKDALMFAAVSGQTEIVRALLKAGADLNAKDKEGKTALMLANEKEHAEVVEALRGSGKDESGFRIQEFLRAATKGDAPGVRRYLDSGAGVNSPEGMRALISATLHGHTEVVRLLIEAGMDVNAKFAGQNDWGLRVKTDALALAARKGHLGIVRLLIEAGANVKRSRAHQFACLELAADGGHVTVLRELLGAGFPIKGNAGLAALESAIQHEQEQAALVLVEAGVRPRGTFGARLLVSAVEEGMVRLVEALLDAGVDPRVRNESDKSALQAARSAGRKDLAAILERARSPQASPALEFTEAAEQGDLKTVHRLILEGVNLESRDAKGATALIRASAGCHLPVMKALLAAGANPNASTPFARRERKGMFHFDHMDLTTESPLSCAVTAQCLPAVEMLLDAGADIRKTECGHVACMILQAGTKEGAALVERLLDAGMDPDSRWPAIRVGLLELAAQENHAGLVEKLIRLGARLKTPIERDRAILNAIRSDRVDVARILIGKGISPEAKGVITSEALLCAAMKGRDEIVRLLLERGLKIDRRRDAHFDSEGGVEGVTALMAAARHGRVSTVELLLSAGAHPGVEDGTRRTALDWAQDNPSRNIAQRICRLLEAALARK